MAIVTADKNTISNGLIDVDSTWLFKFFNDNYIIYKLPRIEFKDSKTKMRQDTIDLVFSSPDTTFKYYIVKNDEDMGMQYDNDLNKVKQFSLDSLLKENGLHLSMFGVYQLRLTKPDKIEDYGNIKIEKYFKKKLAEGDSDSIYRYFDKKLSNINFSYSPFLDKKAKSKLFKTSFINIYKPGEMKNNVIRTELYSEFKEVNILNQDFLEKIVKKYQHDKK